MASTPDPAARQITRTSVEGHTAGQLPVEKYKSVLGTFCSGITIIGALVGDEPVGLTCQSFFAVSLDPPLVGFSVARSSTSFPRIRNASTLTINILGEDQDGLSRAFSRSGADKWRDVMWERSAHGTPRISACLAWIHCGISAEYDAGDHIIILARVLDLESNDSGGPLLYFKGEYASIRGSERP
jgi:3-hydroxy-9,10-secoandrosta-1,3,5(10)-triene-9,17-dione monooxygenase reductase component